MIPYYVYDFIAMMGLFVLIGQITAWYVRKIEKEVRGRLNIA